MHTILKHEGIDFRVFDPESVAHSKEQIKRQAASGLATITRKVRLFQIYEGSLHQTLTKADEVFEKIASACGAQVVEHIWGLYPTSHRNTLYDELGVTPHLPEGYDMAARIKVLPYLRPLAPTDSPSVLIEDAIRRHLEGESWPKWWDASSTHFMVASEAPTVGDTVHLVDIEPLIEINPDKAILFLQRR